MTKILALCFVLLAIGATVAGCDNPFADYGDAICGTDPADCPPVMPPTPTCGTFIPDLSPPTDIWACNLPASASDGAVMAGTPPCGLFFCELTSATEQAVILEAQDWFQMRGFQLPADGQTQVECKKTDVSTWNKAYDIQAIWSPAECVEEKTAPCAMFGETCSSGMSNVSNPSCCQPPESTFAMVCNEGVSMQGGVCCVPTGAACQPGLPNGGCCPVNADGVLDLCGDGTNSDANHVGLCCGANGASCQNPAEDPQSDDFCCSGLCLPDGAGYWQCSDY